MKEFMCVKGVCKCIKMVLCVGYMFVVRCWSGDLYQGKGDQKLHPQNPHPSTTKSL